MAKTKYTQGPWVDTGGSIDARYLSGIGEVRLIRCIGENDNRYVAMASLDAMGSDSHVKTSPQERDANARLIAAAPNLLTSLQEMLDTFGGADPKDEHGNAVLDRAIDAITKATAP